MATFPVFENQLAAQSNSSNLNSMGRSSSDTERLSGDAGNLVSIVDDDDSIRKSIGRLIKSAGLRAEMFGSAEDFLEFGNQFETACLILDVRLTGMSGLDLQRRLADEESRVPIIFISAHDEERSRSQAMKSGAIAFLGKPFDDKGLLELVHSALK